MIRHLFVLKLAALALFATIWLVPQQSDAQVMLEVNGKVGATSATISDIQYGDPIFDIGGGVQAAAMIRFVGGIAAGLNFNIQYDGHRMSGNAPRADSMSFFVPSVGVTARYELMPMVNAGAWLNYCFGSATVSKDNLEANWAVQGFEGGASVALNYQMKPYKTFIILGLYAYFEYLQLFIDQQNLTEKQYSDMNAPNNIGIGALLGVRFDLTL